MGLIQVSTLINLKLGSFNELFSNLSKNLNIV